jgi:dipeptidase E
VAQVNLLLLSWGFGAVPGFLADTTGKSLSQLTIGYIDDAKIPYADPSWAKPERDRLVRLGATVVDLSGARQERAEFATTIERTDAVYVAGGNTFALLWALRRAGAEQILDGRVREGLPYIGCSAGSVIAGPDISPVERMDDPGESPGPVDPHALGWIDTVPIPHADGQIPIYPPSMIESVRRDYGTDRELTMIADNEALLVRGTVRTLVASAD